MKTELTEEKKLSRWLVFLLASACGLIVANQYYAQPLVGPISADIGLSVSASGLIVTTAQFGFAVGLLFLVPLCDLMENRRLVVSVLAIAVLGLLTAAIAKSSYMFFIAAALTGVGSVAAQILVPYAANLAPSEQLGKIVGNVMSGLLMGVMLARPAASLITSVWGWHAVFFISAVIMGILMLLLSRQLPKRNPQPQDDYHTIIKSLWYIFTENPVLRRRSLYQAALFGSFSLFWTVTPLWLSHHFHLSQKEIAVFALLGVSGAVAAPIAGRLADRGWTRKLTGIAFITAASSFGITHFLQNNQTMSLITFGVAAVLLNMAFSGNLVLGQQAIYGLGDKIRGRVNGIFMAVYFAGGAIGSALGGWAYANGNWATASIIGFSLPVLAFLYYLTEKK